VTAPTPTSTPDATLRGPHGPSGLHIVGGTYREFCPESVPAWDQLFGSGLRAAAAVQALAQADGRPATLVTCVGDDLAEDLAVYAGTFGVRVRVTRIADTVAFLYEHPLAPARMKPAAEALLPRVPLECAAPNVLRFGMPEADVWVRGERVVYDPQSPVPERFDTNGSSAQALAIVANLREAEALTGRSAEAEGVGAIGRALCREHGAAVGVIKRGARGLSVFAASDGDVTEATLPGYETQRVWPIGSGDTFSAVFAYHWAERRSDPLAAADAASRATAYYCETRQPVSPVDVEAALGRRLRRLRPAPEGERRQVYLAGPFFTMAQRWLIRHVRRSLRDQGVEVFSPLNDVGFVRRRRWPARTWRAFGRRTRCSQSWTVQTPARSSRSGRRPSGGSRLSPWPRSSRTRTSRW